MIIINKIYKKVKSFIKENYKSIIFIIVVFFLFFFKLPYYIYAPGGLISTSDKIETSNKINFKGSLNMAYVSTIRGTPITLLYALINKSYDIESVDDVTVGAENIEDEEYRNKMLLEEANNIALEVAYKHSNVSYKVQNNKIYVTYVDASAKTNLKVQDQIIKIDGHKVKDKEYLYNYIKEKKPNDKISFTVINNNKTYQKEAKLINVGGVAKVGIVITETKDIKSSKNIDIKFKSTESGSSGGLMIALTLYSYINEIDLTNGKTIVGTGTIEKDGTVGEISGIKYKLAGAVKKGASIFIVPKGNNYKEAKKLKEKYNYKIKLVPVSTFEDALNYLKK